eukprot:476864_1
MKIPGTLGKCEKKKRALGRRSRTILSPRRVLLRLSKHERTVVKVRTNEQCTIGRWTPRMENQKSAPSFIEMASLSKHLQRWGDIWLPHPIASTNNLVSLPLTVSNGFPACKRRGSSIIGMSTGKCLPHIGANRVENSQHQKSRKHTVVVPVKQNMVDIFKKSKVSRKSTSKLLRRKSEPLSAKPNRRDIFRRHKSNPVVISKSSGHFPPIQMKRAQIGEKPKFGNH